MPRKTPASLLDPDRPVERAPRRTGRVRRAAVALIGSAVLLGSVAVLASVAQASEATTSSDVSTPPDPVESPSDPSVTLISQKPAPSCLTYPAIAEICLFTKVAEDGKGGLLFVTPQVRFDNLAGMAVTAKIGIQPVTRDGRTAPARYDPEDTVDPRNRLLTVYSSRKAPLGCYRAVVTVVQPDRSTASYASPRRCLPLPGSGSESE